VKIKKILSALIVFFAVLTSLQLLAAPTLEEEKKLSADYVEQMKQEAGAQVLDQNVVIRSIYNSSSTESPTVDQTVKVIYALTDREGHMIETSITDDEVVTFPLNKLISCWQIAIPHMTFGSFAKVTCPSDTAYGDKGVKDDQGQVVIAPGAALTFRIQLLQ
jgi:FKBP-type peptidyl-prolyl cis-trans isomerase FkpA